MDNVAFVPLRLNSKRVPGKNLRRLGDRALCWYVFEHLLAAKVYDAVYAFCSDESVMQHVPRGVEFIPRTTGLDGDLVRGLQIYLAFADAVHASVYTLAHATSPFVTSETYARATKAVCSGRYDSAFSVERKQTFCWYKGTPLNYSFTEIPRTQELEPVFVETSGFYIFRREILVNHKRRIGFTPLMVELSPLEALDIDEEQDFALAVALLQSTARQ